MALLALFYHVPKLATDSGVSYTSQFSHMKTDTRASVPQPPQVLHATSPTDLFYEMLIFPEASVPCDASHARVGILLDHLPRTAIYAAGW